MQIPSFTSFLSISFLLVNTTQSFTSISTKPSPISATCSQSSLFRTTPIHPKSCKLNHMFQMTTADSNNDNNKEDEAETSSLTNSSEIVETKIGSSRKSSSSKSQNIETKSALVTALVMGPPLLAKFAIVILVKIATDLVVFPLLFFYRFCNMIKNKIVGLFTQRELMKGKKINGAS